MDKKLKEIIANCCKVDVSKISVNAAVNKTPNWDSMGHLQIMVCVEQEFGLTLDAKTISALTSYKDILSYLKEHGKK